ncbi:MAG: hypothetical protein JO360_11890, partial [Acidobacteria bacterium]|nr:hypothetical protein [Acidobacteriota bacterium]
MALMVLTMFALLCFTSSPGRSVTAQEESAAGQRPAGAGSAVLDFTGDGRTDFSAVTLGNTGTPLTWKILRNPADPAPNQAFIRIFEYGLNGDAINPADYLGDGKTELSIWRSGNDYISPFPETSGLQLSVINWGVAGDNLGREGDYDGDGKDDPTIIRVAAGQLTW